jgi:hypothetical protein
MRQPEMRWISQVLEKGGADKKWRKRDYGKIETTGDFGLVIRIQQKQCYREKKEQEEEEEEKQRRMRRSCNTSYRVIACAYVI